MLLEAIAREISKRDNIPRGLCGQMVGTFCDVLVDALEKDGYVCVYGSLRLRIVRGQLIASPLGRLKTIVKSKQEPVNKEKEVKNVSPKKTKRASSKPRGKRREKIS